MKVSLRPFDAYPAAPPVVSTLLASVCPLPDGALHLEFSLEGRMEALRVPLADAPPPGPLWQHTCFEAFVSTPDTESYCEFNFSPAGLWAAGAFRRYRERARALEENLAPLPVTSTQHTSHLTLTAEIPLLLLPSSPVLRLGIAAVIEHMDGKLEYWALHHPVGCPDFHHPDGWTLLLDR